MRHLLDLAGGSDWLKHITLFVNHSRIAEQPLELSLKVEVSDALGDEAMLKKLLELSS